MTEDEIDRVWLAQGGANMCGLNWFRNAVIALLEAARATAEQSRNSVIEECAKVCDAMANEFEDQRQFALDLCSDAIRALKSQQDAAIEAQRSGNGE